MPAWNWKDGYPGVPPATAIGRKFTTYRAVVIPPAADVSQVLGSELAFYAGAEAMFDLLSREAPDDERQAMQFMASLKNELLARAQRYAQTRT